MSIPQLLQLRWIVLVGFLFVQCFINFANHRRLSIIEKRLKERQ